MTEPVDDLRMDLWADPGIRVDSAGNLETEFRTALVDVLARLPEEDRERAISLVTGWVIVDTAAYHVVYRIPPRHRRERGEATEVRIVVVPGSMVRGNPNGVRTLVAHELAHILLGHGPHANGAFLALEHEREADQQVRAWGFEPAYSEAQFQDRKRELRERLTETQKPNEHEPHI